MEGRRSVRRLPLPQSRSLLILIAGGSAFGLLLALSPLLKQRLPAQPAGAGPMEPAAAAAPRAEDLLAPAATELPDGTRLRRAEQLALAREDLLLHQRELAALPATGGPRGFSWRRQALVALGTVVLALTAVSLALKLGLGWSVWRRRLQAEESRLRALQLSVLGALEELQATLATAEAEAQRSGSRRPSSDAGAGGVLANAPAVARGVTAERKAAPPEPRRAPAAAAISSRQGTSEGPAAASSPRPRPAGWAARLLGENQAAEETAEGGQRPLEGPWQEPVRRRAARRRSAPAAAWVKELEGMIAQGLTIPQIARRLQVSREEVALALAVHQQPAPGGATERCQTGEGSRTA